MNLRASYDCLAKMSRLTINLDPSNPHVFVIAQWINDVIANKQAELVNVIEHTVEKVTLFLSP